MAFGIEGLTSCELYPFPIPDLFCGLPLLVTGKFEGQFPETITINGKMPDGNVWSQRVPVSGQTTLPLDKVFVKQRLDMLTAQAWLQNSAKLELQVSMCQTLKIVFSHLKLENGLRRSPSMLS